MYGAKNLISYDLRLILSTSSFAILANIDGTLLFVEQKRFADFLATLLSDKGHRTTSIHGDRQQFQREEALRDFKTQRMSILVATNVAARGLGK